MLPCKTTNAEITAKEISRWIRTFAGMNVWMSDRGSHLKNEAFELVAEEYNVEYHFVTTYSPWANETVERVMRGVRSAAEALLAEFGLAPQDRPDVISIIQVFINSSPPNLLERNTSRSHDGPDACARKFDGL